jgi:hypothetical protein
VQSADQVCLGTNFLNLACDVRRQESHTVFTSRIDYLSVDLYTAVADKVPLYRMGNWAGAGQRTRRRICAVITPAVHDTHALCRCSRHAWL